MHKINVISSKLLEALATMLIQDADKIIVMEDEVNARNLLWNI